MSVRNGNSADATASTATLSDVSTNRVVTTTLEGLQIAEDGEILGGLVPPHLLSAGGEDLSMNGPVTCHDCGRSYSTVSHLKQHRRSKHEGVVWKCAHDGCDKSYCDPSTLRKHVRSSHEGVTFECIEPSCKKIYHQRGHMLRHYASKHLNKRHACDAPDCTNKYAHADNLRRHKLRDHKSLLDSGALMLTSNITTRGVSNEAIAAAAGLRSADDPQNASTADISNNGNSNSSSNSNIHSLNGLIDVLPGDASIVNVPPPPAKRGRKRKVPLEPSMALPPPPRPLPLEETDADGTITTTLDGGSILPPVAMLGAPLPKKRGRKPKNPPPSIAVGVELPQNLIHVQQQLPFGMRFNSQYVTVLPPLPPPPPPPDLSQLSRAHGMNNGHSHLPPVIFGGAVPPPPPQFALMQSLNGFTSVPPLPLPTDRGGFGNGNSSFLHHPLPPRRVP